MRGLVNTRVGVMHEIGWDPEWEVNPKELKLVERIGEGGWCSSVASRQCTSVLVYGARA